MGINALTLFVINYLIIILLVFALLGLLVTLSHDLLKGKRGERKKREKKRIRGSVRQKEGERKKR